jgi:hypothetical protein
MLQTPTLPDALSTADAGLSSRNGLTVEDAVAMLPVLGLSYDLGEEFPCVLPGFHGMPNSVVEIRCLSVTRRSTKGLRGLGSRWPRSMRARRLAASSFAARVRHTPVGGSPSDRRLASLRSCCPLSPPAWPLTGRSAACARLRTGVGSQRDPPSGGRDQLLAPVRNGLVRAAGAGHRGRPPRAAGGRRPG